MSNPLTVYLSSLVDEMSQCGIDHCVISPGSRSTPISLLIAEHPKLQTYVVVDERSAGFFALGASKATYIPSVLVCTSGTAVANYLPAIVEAYYSRIPLIVLTADRPHELRDVGAPQAIDQLKLFQNYTKAFFEAALPEDREEMVRYIRILIRRAYALATTSPAGVVHINLPFREPLLPDLSDPLLFTYGRSQEPMMVETGHRTLPGYVFDQLAEKLHNVARGLIICGPHHDVSFIRAVHTLAERLGYPILADPLSQLRLSGTVSHNIIEGYDALLRNESFAIQNKPDLILRFGAMPVSKPLTITLQQRWKNTPCIVIDGGSQWRDPIGATTEMYYCDETVFCYEISRRIEQFLPKDHLWLHTWQQANNITIKTIQHLQSKETINEGQIYLELSRLLPDGSQLYISNSMPIRDVDTFFHQQDKKIALYCNRGANGIDGTIASALGATLNGKKTVLVTGDLAFYHDLNSLAIASLNKLNLTIILVNNNGGGIFSFLPQAEDTSSQKHFEKIFATPLNLPFEHAAKLFGVSYALCTNWEQFHSEVQRGLNEDGVHLIEVQTMRQENVVEHRTIWNEVNKQVDSYLKGYLQ